MKLIEPYNICFDKEVVFFNVIDALGNREVDDALKEKDFDKFTTACEKLNLFDEMQTVRLNSLSKNGEGQIFFESRASPINPNASTRSVALWVAVTVVVVIAIVVTYTAGLQSEKKVEKGHHRSMADEYNDADEGQEFGLSDEIEESGGCDDFKTFLFTQC